MRYHLECDPDRKAEQLLKRGRIESLIFLLMIKINWLCLFVVQRFGRAVSFYSANGGALSVNL